jgi:hypothetical protein
LQLLGVGDATAKLGEGVGLRGQNGPIRKCDISFLLAPHSDQSAISTRFRRTQQSYRQTRTDIIGIAIVDLMLCASIGRKNEKSSRKFISIQKV